MSWAMSSGFRSKFLALSSSAKVWKSVEVRQSYRQLKVGTFFETQCSLAFCMKSPRLRLFLAGLVQLDRNSDCVSGTYSCCHAVWCFVTFVWQFLMQLTRRNAGLETTQRRSCSITVSMTIKDRMSLIWFLANVNSRSRSLYAIARPSVCLSVCLSVCRLSSVCL